MRRLQEPASSAAELLDETVKQILQIAATLDMDVKTQRQCGVRDKHGTALAAPQAILPVPILPGLAVPSWGNGCRLRISNVASSGLPPGLMPAAAHVPKADS